MFLEELVPRNDYLHYIPNFVNSDDIKPEAIPALAPTLESQDMSNYHKLGFISGAMDLQEVLQSNSKIEEGARASTWFKTSEIVDVRLFFRMSNKNPDRAIGSKLRMYSMGKPYKASDNAAEEVQPLDTGFLHFNGSTEPTMVFQNAMATTQLYNIFYCMGGPAKIRKVNEPADDRSAAPSYKWISACSAMYSEDIDRKSYTHILHPALDYAGIDREFFVEETLDDIVMLFRESRDMADVEKRLGELAGEDLDYGTVCKVIKASSDNDANLSNSRDFHEAPGINLIVTLRTLYDLLGE